MTPDIDLDALRRYLFDDVPKLIDELDAARAEADKLRAERDHLRQVLDAANATTEAAQRIVTAALADGTATITAPQPDEDEPFDCAPECRCGKAAGAGDGEQDTATCGHPAIWLRQPGNRRILCTLPADHDGDHQEPATRSHWSHNGEHGNVQTGDPRPVRAPASVQGAADGEAQA